MDREYGEDLLIRAVALHQEVIADPMAHGEACAAVVELARAAMGTGSAREAEALVVALRAQASYEHARQSSRRAKSILDEAVGLARRHDHGLRLQEALLSRAAVNLELGRYEAARSDIADASTAAPGGLASLDLQLASLLYNAGHLDDAAQLCRRAFDDPDTPVDVRAKLANNLAIIEVQRGRSDIAMELLDEAVGLAAKVGPAPSAIVASSRAWALAQSGRLAEAMAEFAEAQDRYAASGLPIGELLLEQLDAYIDLRLLPEAEDLADRVMAEFRTHGAVLMLADAQLRAAKIAMIRGDVAAARRLARDVVVDFRLQRRTGWTAQAETLGVQAADRLGQVGPADLATVRRAARVLERLGHRAAAVEAHLAAGRAALARSRRADALRHLAAAQRLARRGSVLVRLRGRLAGAVAARERHDDRETLRHCRAGLADLSRHRAALGSMELRALASGHGAELGSLGLGSLIRSHSTPAVLSWMERTRAAALLTVAPPAGPEIMAHLAALTAVHAELHAAVQSGGAEPPALLTRQAALETEIRRASWSRLADRDAAGPPVTIAEGRRVLGDRHLVAFGELEGDSFAIVVTVRHARLVELGPVAQVGAEAERLLFSLRRLTRPGPDRSLAAARASAEHGLRRLRELLLAPLDLDPECPLVVLPDVATRLVPWSGLQRAPVMVAPSLSVWVRSVAVPGSAPGHTVLVAGPGLPGAEAEVRTLSPLHPGATVLTPPESTVPAVSSALAGADLAHLACHGLLRVDNPTFSALRLSGGDLTLHELDRLGRSPRRVVLAACDSATGVGYDGGEVLGFVGALMARGTEGLVASVAPIGDIEAVELNVALHRSLADGATMADALYGARSQIATAEPRAFVNWCATTAFGGG